MFKKFIVLFSILLNIQCQAQIDGTLDTTFGNGGKIYFNIGITGSYARAIKTEQNGKFIICGDKSGGSFNKYFLMRFKLNGDRDSTFGINGIVDSQIQLRHSMSNDIQIQQDGKYLVLGTLADTIQNIIFLARYNSNGSIDSTFGINGVVQTTISGYRDLAFRVELQTDSKIVICGYTQTTSSNADLIVLRYNPNGTLDNTFDGDGILVLNYLGLGDFGFDLTIQNDGKILVCGYYWASPYNSDLFLVRLNTNGTLDLSFNNDGMVQTAISGSVDQANSVCVLANGNIMIGGESSGSSSSTRYFTLARYTPNGYLDNTFDNDGVLTSSFNSNVCSAGKLLIQNNGKLILVGISNLNSSNDFAIAKYNNNGSLDITFNNTGKTLTDFYNTNDIMQDAVLQYDEKIIVVGGSNSHVSIARYLNSQTTTGFDAYRLQKDEVTFFPNPTNKQVTINSTTEFDELQLFNYAGQLLINQKFQPSTNHSLNMSEFPFGIYIIKTLIQSRHINSSKLIKN